MGCMVQVVEESEMFSEPSGYIVHSTHTVDCVCVCVYVKLGDMAVHLAIPYVYKYTRRHCQFLVLSLLLWQSDP